MPHVVGITADPDGSREEWEQQHPELRAWRVEGPYHLKSQAQARADQVAEEHGCEYDVGDDEAESDRWWAYHFYY